jgi:acetyltransferase-like isoleucine patch superfamily enzyme
MTPDGLLRNPHRRVTLRGRLLRPLRARQFAAFGAGSVIDRPRWLRGTHRAEVGANVMVLRGAWIAVERDAWKRPGPALVIGDEVAINTGATITCAESVVIEDGVLMAANVTVIDCDHTMRGALNPAYNPLVTAPIRIGRGSWLGQNAVVLRGSTIGEGCVIGANAVVRGDIPAHSVAVGAPARVVGST